MQHRVRRIALTGGIATGKSHVLDVFAGAGIPVLDTDVLARDVVKPASPALAAISARFGAGVIHADGTLDRRALAGVVFQDAGARRDLEAIVHPLIREATERWFASLDPLAHPIAVVAIPLLFETGRAGDFDLVIATTCAPETQLRRLMARDALSEEEAQRRLAAQLPAAEKARRADYAIATDGPVDDTAAQVRALIARLRAATG